MLDFLKFWKKKEPSEEKDIFTSLDEKKTVKGKLDDLIHAFKKHHRAMEKQHRSILDLKERKAKIQKDIKQKTFNLIKKRIEEGKKKREIVEEVMKKTGYSESSAYKFIKEVKKKRVKERA